MTVSPPRPWSRAGAAAARLGAGVGAAARVGAGVEDVARCAVAPPTLRGAAREATWLAAHAALYPLGAVAERLHVEEGRFSLGDLPPEQRGLLVQDVEAAGTPILLVHGLVDNRSVFARLRRGLRRRGFGRVVSLNYSVLTRDVRAAADTLAAVVERLAGETGYEQVHVVGHSMGGLVARYYVQRRGGDARVHTLVTLGTPHEGTQVARVLPHPLLRQLRPGSDVVRELAEPAPGCRTRFVAFAAGLDEMVVPQRHARVTHPDLTARNVTVRDCGHMSLPFAGRVAHEICTTLAHLDHHGAALASRPAAAAP
jgi:triacylglycerol lipase